MGAIVAVVHREEKTAASTVLAMLKELSHRGKDVYAIASADDQTLSGSIEQLNSEKIRSNIVLGYIFSKTLPNGTQQLYQTDNFILAFEGRTYPPSKIVEELLPNPERTAEEIIKNCDGAYVFAVVTTDSLIVGRDTLGLAPLYFARNQSFVAFASERKALWKLGLRAAESFPPGNIAVVKKDAGTSFKRVKAIAQPPLKPLKMDSAAEQLQKLLLQSIKARVSDVKEVAVAFSGGLDSGLVAFLAKKCRVEVELITVGLENMPETRHAEDAAKALALPIHVKTYTVNDVKKALPRVFWLIEEPNIMQASIAIPLYWTAEQTKTRGFNVLLAGQGADELFGGYHRYLAIYAKNGAEVLQKILFYDVARCYAMNFQRDNQTCAFHNVELRLPFADLRLVNFALSLPLSLKIESATDMLRKRVLRQAAENMGMPMMITQKTKKAVQYATGVDKALRKLAEREGLNPADYVRKVFREVYPDVKLE